MLESERYTMKILVVEDEENLSEALTQLLEDQGYNTEAVYDGEAALKAIEGAPKGYDAVILDLMIPKMDGIEVLKTVGGKNINIPVLILTARDGVESKVQGLDAGADDYLTKPFQPEELLARVRALTRRQTPLSIDILHYGDLSLDLVKFVLSCNGRRVTLGKKEFEIMRLLLTDPTATISKEQLIDKVWGGEIGIDGNNVEVYISFLRKKLLFLRTRICIQTIRKIGYTLGYVE